MTSRERVRAVLARRDADRIPVNYIGTPEVNAKLRQHFGLEDPRDGRPGDVVVNDWDIQARLGSDLRTLRLRYQGPPLPQFDDGAVQNYWGVIRRPMHTPSGIVMESMEFPWAAFQTLSDMEQYPWPDPDWFDYAGLAKECSRFEDCAIIYGWPGNVDMINGTSFARGFEQTIFDMALGDPVGLACMQKRFDFYYEQSRRALEACGGRVDILWIGDDFGTQKGLLVGPPTWRKLFGPKVRAMADLAHRFGAKLMLHSCGSTRKVWPDLVDSGVDIYDTVQPEAAGMVPAELAAEFGASITLHGTISTQQTLPFGSPEDVAAEVRDRLELFRAKGGIILAPSHNILSDTPTENVLAMYRAAGSLA